MRKMTTTPEQSKQFRTDQVMQGSKAVNLIIPAGMKFVTVLNSTDNKVELYTGSIDYNSADVRDSLIQSVPYYNQTMPIPNDLYYTLVWRDGGATGVKVVTVIFTVESMNINGSTGAPGTNQNVVITADQANLAKASQLPGNLVNGNLAVEVRNSAPVTIQGEVEIKNDTGSAINVNVGNDVKLLAGQTVNVGNLPATQPVSIADAIHAIIDSLPAVTVTGGATSAKQDTIITSLGTIKTVLDNLVTLQTTANDLLTQIKDKP